MSKSKSRRLSQQASSTAKSTVKISEATKDTIQLSENTKDTLQLAEDAQDTAQLVEDASAESNAEPTSATGKLAGEAKGKPTSVASKAASAKEKPTSTASKQAAAASAKEKPTTTASKQAAARALPPVHRPLTRDAAKYERRQAERQSRFLAQRRARRVRNTVIIVAALVVLLGVSIGGYFYYSFQHGSAQAATAAPFQETIFDNNFPPVDNIYCDQLEGQVEHIHAHLTIYIDGQQVPLPANVGIAANSQTQQATCFYWLHVHDTTGVVHIEAPTTEPFMLSQFLDEWNQQFNSLGFPPQLLLNSGWTIWVDGKIHHGDLSSVELNAHDLITIAYNSPHVKPDTKFAWPAGE